MTNNLEDEIRAIVASMDNQEQDNTQTPHEDIHDVYVLFVREQEEDHTHIVESNPTTTTTQQDSFLSAYVFVCCSLFLLFSTLAFQLYCIMNPLVATIIILPRSQQVTLSGTLQIGRVLPPLTISQSQVTLTTGKGHQPAEQARGFVTLYNGQFQTVTIAAGTILTGADGEQIITDQDAIIPAGNPASGYGHIIVPAHAIITGSNGNIPAYDINQACCATSVLAVNLSSFGGGQNKRDFSTVSTQDIHKISTPLKIAVTQSMQGALDGQLRNGEQLQILPCTPTVTSDHQPGQEATSVTVTVSQTCSAVVYNSQELKTKATVLLSHQALAKLAGYSLFGTVQVHVTQANIASTPPHLVFLSFKASGMWIYGISPLTQEQIKHLIAGKTTQQALTLLMSVKGIEQVSIRLSGFGDATRLPKSTQYIHLTIIVV